MTAAPRTVVPAPRSRETNGMRKFGLAAGLWWFICGAIVGAQDRPMLMPAGGAGGAAGNLRVAKEFKLELIYSVPKATQGSWVAMCADPRGRLIVSDQHGKLF